MRPVRLALTYPSVAGSTSLIGNADSRACPQSDSNRHCADFKSVSAHSPVFVGVHFTLSCNMIHPWTFAGVRGRGA
jgi:hypothetical protein